MQEILISNAYNKIFLKKKFLDSYRKVQHLKLQKKP